MLKSMREEAWEFSYANKTMCQSFHESMTVPRY